MVRDTYTYEPAGYQLSMFDERGFPVSHVIGWPSDRQLFASESEAMDTWNKTIEVVANVPFVKQQNLWLKYVAIALQKHNLQTPSMLMQVYNETNRLVSLLLLTVTNPDLS